MTSWYTIESGVDIKVVVLFILSKNEFILSKIYSIELRVRPIYYVYGYYMTKSYTFGHVLRKVSK